MIKLNFLPLAKLLVLVQYDVMLSMCYRVPLQLVAVCASSEASGARLVRCDVIDVLPCACSTEYNAPNISLQLVAVCASSEASGARLVRCNVIDVV